MNKPTLAEYQMPSHEYLTVKVNRRAGEVTIGDAMNSVPIPSDGGLAWLIATLTDVAEQEADGGA